MTAQTPPSPSKRILDALQAICMAYYKFTSAGAFGHDVMTVERGTCAVEEKIKPHWEERQAQKQLERILPPSPHQATISNKGYIYVVQSHCRCSQIFVQLKRLILSNT